MPQPSIAYACGRIGTLGRDALKRTQIERLMAAHTYEEAKHTLLDIGFLSADGVDFQTAADQHVLKACRLIKDVTPDEQVMDSFLLRYDIHNLKVLIKSRFLAQSPEFLSKCGSMDVNMLRHAVADHTYGQLPEVLRETLEALEKKLAVKFDPMTVDAELDKAMYRQIFAWLKDTKAKTILTYFQAKVDLQNVVMLLRAGVMKKDGKFFEGIALPGGKVAPAAFVKAFHEPDRLGKLLQGYGNAVYQQVITAALNPAKLPMLEKVIDDYLYGLFVPYRYKIDALETLAGYLLQKQREATDIRLIMAGKLNGFQEEAVAERVRELHG